MQFLKDDAVQREMGKQLTNVGKGNIDRKQRM